MPVSKKPAKAEGEAAIDLGFGGLFKGLGTFIDLLGELIETGEEEIARRGEFRVKGMGDKVHGVYGFTVRTGIGGIPRVERFGNIRATEHGPVVAEVREPLVDVFDEGEEVLIVAELPGVGEGELRVDVQDDILALETTGERKFAKEILLPERVDPGSLRQAFTNGILELRLRKV
jgi:HSP20 family protein